MAIEPSTCLLLYLLVIITLMSILIAAASKSLEKHIVSDILPTSEIATTQIQQSSKS